MTEMSYLLLQNNSIRGTLPVEWGAGSMPAMYYMNISENLVSVLRNPKHAFTSSSTCWLTLQPAGKPIA